MDDNQDMHVFKQIPVGEECHPLAPPSLSPTHQKTNKQTKQEKEKVAVTAGGKKLLFAASYLRREVFDVRLPSISLPSHIRGKVVLIQIPA